MRQNLISDEELMRRVSAGDTRAFEELHRRYRGRVFSFAVRLAGRPGVAEEITQDAFLSLWRSAHRFDAARGSLLTWLLSVVRNRGVDSLRRETRNGRIQTVDLAQAERVEAQERTDEEVVSRERSGEVRRMITELSLVQREVIQLGYFGGLSHTEIAARVQVPLGTVKGRQRLALNRLRVLAGQASLEAA